tara:strand:+ start:1178 stop:1837 length:660 start_codon:yes stop_codon:yes gene_type:complete
MHQSINNLNIIKSQIIEELKKLNNNELPKIIAVSKTFSMDKIEPLLKHGHTHFGENKVQEAILKWSNIKTNNKNFKLHLIGKLQTNKTKQAVKLFDYIHSLDSVKLAKEISKQQKIINKTPKLFIQINIGNEEQKSGINKNELVDFYNVCKELELDIIGLMCLPPLGGDLDNYFSEMKELNNKLNLKELSMGMSDDYLMALRHSSTFLRIGTKIFGARS